MFGSNPNGSPTTVTVAGITTHIRSDLTAITGAVASHTNVDNKSSTFSLSSRGAASASAQSAQLNMIDNADPEDLDSLLSSPTPGAALPGLAPDQLKSIKKNTSRAVSNPNVKRTFRPGDPRSPEMIMKKKEEEEDRVEQERLAKAKEAQRTGRSVGREMKRIEGIRKDVAKERYDGSYDELVTTLTKYHTDNVIDAENKRIKREMGLKSRVKKKKIMTAEEKAQQEEMDKYLIYDAEEGEGEDEKKDGIDNNAAAARRRKMKKIASGNKNGGLDDYSTTDDSSDDDSSTVFRAGEGGFTMVDGVMIANAMVKAGEETVGRTLWGPAPVNLVCEECER